MSERKRTKISNDDDGSYLSKEPTGRHRSRPQDLSRNTYSVTQSRRGPSRGRPSRARTPGLGNTRVGTSHGGTSGVRSSRTATARVDDAFVVAIIENNLGEVGFCSFNLNGFEVELRQHTDSNQFSSIPSILCVFNPVEIVLSLTSVNGPLDDALNAHNFTRDIKRTCISRNYFNENQGANFVERLSVERCPHLSNLATSQYYLALSACGALLRYVEHTNNMVFSPNTLVIKFKPKEGSLFLDMSTIEGLELLQNNLLSSQTRLQRTFGSQLSVMDKTKTRAGKRLLRRSLIEPPAELPTIRVRQDAVEELMNKESLYFGICKALQSFPDIERALACLIAQVSLQIKRQVVEPNKASAPVSRATASSSAGLSKRPKSALSDRIFIEETKTSCITIVRNVIYLKAGIDCIERIWEEMQEVESTLLTCCTKSIQSEYIANLRQAIDDVIVPEAAPSKDVEQMHLQGAFAVTPGRNEQLDVARKTLSDIVGEIHALSDSLRDKYEYSKLDLKMSARRGYHLTYPAKAINKLDLPIEFVQVQTAGIIYRFTTPELASLNSRYFECLSEVWKYTNYELGALLNIVFEKETISALYLLSDSVAMIDQITSFVTYSIMSAEPLVRPSIIRDGPAFAFKKAHHPILLSLKPTTSIPNDICMDETSALHIITGRNQSGKSTLIKTAGLLVIVAHTGCWVSAERATVRVCDRIMSRFSTSDEINAGQSQSHFSKEMADAAVILHAIQKNEDIAKAKLRPLTATFSNVQWNRSQVFENKYENLLVLMDELGRSTATLDGFTIAMAILEKLVSVPGVYTLFTTHFLGLSAMQSVHPCIRVYHMATKSSLQSLAIQDQSGSPITPEASAQQLERDKGTEYMMNRKEFTFTLTPGVLDVSSYGIETARCAGFPKHVIESALEIKSKSSLRKVVSREGLQFDPQVIRYVRNVRANFAINAHISMFRSKSTDTESLKVQLKNYQQSIRSIMEAKNKKLADGSASRNLPTSSVHTDSNMQN